MVMQINFINIKIITSHLINKVKIVIISLYPKTMEDSNISQNKIIIITIISNKMQNRI